MACCRDSRSVAHREVEAFSDGVFAIAITLLVLELGLRADAGDDLLDAFVDAWPSYLAYVVSFAAIGGAWLAHATMTHHLAAVDAVLLRLNLLLLLVTSFLPFPTGLTAEHLRDDDAERVAVTIFGVSLFLVALLVWVMWRHAVRHDLLDPGVDDSERRALTRRFTPGLAGYLGLLALGLVLPRVAVVGYLVLAVGLLVPTEAWRAPRTR